MSSARSPRFCASNVFAVNVFTVLVAAAAVAVTSNSSLPVTVSAFAPLTRQIRATSCLGSQCNRSHLMTALSSSAMSSASEGDSAQSTQEDATVADVDDHVSQSSTINRIRNTKKEKRKELIRAEGGPLAFDTKYGALNPYAIYYGLVSILLGLVWYVALSAMQLVYLVTGNRFDRKRRIPIFLNHLWGTCLLRLTGAFPVIENRDVLLDFYKQKKAAMFIANHNSWMDIPYLGATIGWRNYKFVAKKELEKVPILGKAIALAMNVCVDRSNRRSQIKTLKSGMQWLKVSRVDALSKVIDLSFC